jgi:hypothetical protein
MPSPERRKRPGKGALDTKLQRPTHKTPSRPAQAATLVGDPVFRRRVQRVYPLGGYVIAHLLAELAIRHDCRGEIERFLDGAIENEPAIRAFGIDQWPPLPLRGVP